MIEQKLIDYFCGDKEYLPALDCMFTNYYQGVRYSYIKEFVLKNEYTDEEIKPVLLNLLQNRMMNLYYCGVVDDPVFSHRNTYEELSVRFKDNKFELNKQFPIPKVSRQKLHDFAEDLMQSQ